MPTRNAPRACGQPCHAHTHTQTRLPAHSIARNSPQGKTLEAAKAILADAQALVDAGVFAIVLEGIPSPVAKMVTENIPVPTIGIGAGPHCDGQVLVFHDCTGFQKVIKPKFVRRYAELQDAAVDALEKFNADCKSGAFPEAAESYAASGEVEEAVELYGKSQ